MIEIWTEELPPSWRWDPSNYVGGTIEMVVEISKNLLKYDDVVVYYDGKTGEWDGVYYLDRKHYLGKNILIAFNSIPEKLAEYNIYSTSWYHAKDKFYKQFNERIVLSPYHKEIFGNDCRIVPLSCNKEEFSNPIKISKQCLFSSSPDRGAEFLDSIWGEVKERTGAELIKTYKKDIDNNTMIKLYKESQFWLHPGDGIELFCISAAKAQTAKCIPIVVPNMALETTVKYGVKTTKEEYKEKLIEAINNPPEIEDVDFGSWEDVANEYMRLYKNV